MDELTSGPVEMIEVGQVFKRGTDKFSAVRVVKNHGVGTGYRLDQHPGNGLVYMPWFRSLEDVKDALVVGGFTLDATHDAPHPQGKEN